MHAWLADAALIWHLVLMLALIVCAIRARARVLRALSIDTAALVLTGFLAIVALRRGSTAYLDVALVLALLAFAGTVALGRFVEDEEEME